jgi:hypothetical protein
MSRSAHDPIATVLPAGHRHAKEVHVESVETYTSVLTVLSVAVLLALSGLATKQLVWKRKAVPTWRRRGC